MVCSLKIAPMPVYFFFHLIKFLTQIFMFVFSIGEKNTAEIDALGWYQKRMWFCTASNSHLPPPARRELFVRLLFLFSILGFLDFLCAYFILSAVHKSPSQHPIPDGLHCHKGLLLWAVFNAWSNTVPVLHGKWGTVTLPGFLGIIALTHSFASNKLLLYLKRKWWWKFCLEERDPLEPGLESKTWRFTARRSIPVVLRMRGQGLGCHTATSRKWMFKNVQITTCLSSRKVHGGNAIP